MYIGLCCFFFQAEDGIRDLVRSRGLGDVYKRQIGNDVYIGPHATFLAAEAPIFIGNKVLFGPNVSILSLIHI